jgi:hypothetical protein
MKSGKKIQLGLVFMICMVVAVAGCTTNNMTNSSSNSSQGNNSSMNTSSSNTSSSNDVNIVINYTGNWACDVSGTFGYRGLSGNGDQTTNMGTISGPVTASARKTEGGSGVLVVSITKGGKTLSTSSTSSPYGGATAYYSV